MLYDISYVNNLSSVSGTLINRFIPFYSDIAIEFIFSPKAKSSVHIALLKYDTSLYFIGSNEIDILCSFSSSLNSILLFTTKSNGKN